MIKDDNRPGQLCRCWNAACVLRNALSDLGNNCDWIHGRETCPSSQCHKGGCNWLPDELWTSVFTPFLLPVCFAELNIEHDGRGLGVIHECPACTSSTTIMGVKSLVPHYLGNLSPHSCRGPLCIIARNRNAWHPDTHTKAVLRWAQLFAAWDELCRCPAPAADNGSRSCRGILNKWVVGPLRSCFVCARISNLFLDLKIVLCASFSCVTNIK